MHPSVVNASLSQTTGSRDIRQKPRRPSLSYVKFPTCPSINFRTPAVVIISLTCLTFRICCQHVVLTAYLCLWTSSPIKSETVFLNLFALYFPEAWHTGYPQRFADDGNFMRQAGRSWQWHRLWKFEMSNNFEKKR